MEGAFAIRLAALGVAVCRIGLLMVGLTSAVGGFTLTGEDAGDDMTEETDEEEVVTAGAVVGEEAVEGSLLAAVVVVVVVDSEALLD